MMLESCEAEEIVGHPAKRRRHNAWKRRTVCIGSIYGQGIQNKGNEIGYPS